MTTTDRMRIAALERENQKLRELWQSANWRIEKLLLCLKAIENKATPNELGKHCAHGAGSEGGRIMSYQISFNRQEYLERQDTEYMSFDNELAELFYTRRSLAEEEVRTAALEREDAALRGMVARYREALENIANDDNWFHCREDGNNTPITAWRGDGEPDEIARAALDAPPVVNGAHGVDGHLPADVASPCTASTGEERMKMDKHTKGPWEARCIERYHYVDGYADGQNDRQVCSTGFGKYSEADAHLIAAAPDLLAMLEEIIEYQGGANNALEDEYVMERAAAAIAKARGEV